jgi:hypothetical protein
LQNSGLASLGLSHQALLRRQIGSGGHGEPEGRAFSWLADYADAAAMRLHDATGDEQTQA